MTIEEKTLLAKQIDKLERDLNTEYIEYKMGYQSGLFDVMELINKLPNNVIQQLRELLKAYAKLIQKDYTNHFFDDAVEESIDQFLAIDYRLRCEEFADGKCRPIVNADWTYLRCKCGKRFEPKG
jgi:hypothetical protein